MRKQQQEPDSALQRAIHNKTAPRCKVCRRRIKDPDSIVMGMGPTCAKRELGVDVRKGRVVEEGSKVPQQFLYTVWLKDASTKIRVGDLSALDPQKAAEGAISTYKSMFGNLVCGGWRLEVCRQGADHVVARFDLREYEAGQAQNGKRQPVRLVEVGL